MGENADQPQSIAGDPNTTDIREEGRYQLLMVIVTLNIIE
jgi:hypothetical protein